MSDISDSQGVLLELAATDTRDARRALRSILKLDAQSLDVERVNAWILSTSPLAITCLEGYLAGSNSYERGQILLGRDYPAYFRAIQEEKVIAADDARVDPHTCEFREGYFKKLGITSMLDVPVWVGGELAGIVCHEHVGSPRKWTPRERELALAVGQAVAAVLQTEHTQRVERERQRATLLSDASALLSETLDVDRVPPQLARLAVPALGDWCVIDVREPGRIQRIAAAHVSPETERLLVTTTATPTPALCALTERAIATGETILLENTSPEQLRALCQDDEVQAKLLSSAGARFLMAVPLVSGSDVFGAVGFGAAQDVPDVDQQVDLAQELARRAALAIRNAQLYRELQSAVSVRDEFLSIASHELSTPIAALQLALQSLHCDSSAAATRAQVIAERQVKRLARLVDELLDVARLRSGRFELTLEPVNLTQVVEEVVEDLRGDLERAGCTITLAAPESVVGRWERSKLERIVSNLLSNAIKFGVGKPIELSVTTIGDTARLVTRNRGVGIPAERLERVFEAYERAVSARQYGGLGLGLYIVRECVVALGGTVQASSSPAEGTTLTIDLPIAGPNGSGHGN